MHSFYQLVDMFFDKQLELDTCYERRYPACERHSGSFVRCRSANQSALRSFILPFLF